MYKAQTEFHRGEMMDLFQIISVPPGVEKFDFISSEWLSKCLHEGLGDDSKITPIDNSGEICPHGRVDPSRVTNMKIISIEAVCICKFLYIGSFVFEKLLIFFLCC